MAPLPDELLEEVLPDPRCEDQPRTDDTRHGVDAGVPDAVGDDRAGEIRYCWRQSEEAVPVGIVARSNLGQQDILYLVALAATVAWDIAKVFVE